MKWTKHRVRLLAFFLEFVASMTITILFIYLEFTQKNKQICDIILIVCAFLFAIAFGLFVYIEIKGHKETGSMEGASGSAERSGGNKTSK